MATTRGTTCPECGTGKTENVAVIDRIDDNGVTVLAHQYSVCEDCFKAQYKRKYGHAPE